MLSTEFEQKVNAYKVHKDLCRVKKEPVRRCYLCGNKNHLSAKYICLEYEYIASKSNNLGKSFLTYTIVNRCIVCGDCYIRNVVEMLRSEIAN